MGEQINPQAIINMIKSGQNPQQVMINLLSQSQISNTPMGKNLLELAKNGNGEEINKIARNIVSQSGKDFDTEFNAFKKRMGL